MLRRPLLLLAAWLLTPSLALACGAVAQRAPFDTPRIMRASTAAEGVTVTFLGHATFLLVSPGGTTVATDYSGDHPAPMPLDIATMNRAHSTHWTPTPDPRIAHVLRGWREDGRAAEHDLTVGDLRVRNLATNIREWGGPGTRVYGNSIFVFETAGLCIAHLGHLHHLLTEDDIAVLGRIDVVMAPMDGQMTLDHQGMGEVLDQLHPRLVLAMHYWDDRTVRRFAASVSDRYSLRWNQGPTTVLSRETLPEQPEILVLPGPHF
jgi:L-ascorbate metabolism protein UlaG (beta-lactamase superfamily)